MIASAAEIPPSPLPIIAIWHVDVELSLQVPHGGCRLETDVFMVKAFSMATQCGTIILFSLKEK